MTDNEIKKALECYISTNGHELKRCPLDDTKKVGICMRLAEYSLDLINRLQAENERLKEKICIQHKIIDERGAEVLRHDRCIRILHEKLKTAKAEAYKEFAEWLNEKRGAYVKYDGGIEIAVATFYIDDFLKEKVGEDK